MTHIKSRIHLVFQFNYRGCKTEHQALLPLYSLNKWALYSYKWHLSFLYIYLPYYNWSKSIEFIKVKNDIWCFVISSCLLKGQFPDFRTLLLRSTLCVCSNVHWLNKWYIVWSPLLQINLAGFINLTRWRQALVFPRPVTIAAKTGFMYIFNLSLSCTWGKCCFVMAQ
jgi:hypothetical protein